MQEQSDLFKTLEADLRTELSGADGRQEKQIEELRAQIQAAAEKRARTKAKKARIAEEMEGLRQQREFEIGEFTRALEEQKVVN